MPRPARVSPDRILAAAAAEFAERGFAGARVDRIARRARVNKAMLYYHFHNKKSLYRAILLDSFTRVAAAVRDVAAGAGPPAEKIDRAIAAMAAFLETHPFLPPMMLREVAERGAHLDADTLRALGAVPQAFSAIVTEGVSAGAFRRVHPSFAYFTMLPPLVFFLAASPIRKQVSALRVVDLQAVSTADFVVQLQDAVRRTLGAPVRAA